MANRQILPAAFKYSKLLADSIIAIKASGIDADISAQAELLSKLSAVTASFKKKSTTLEEVNAQAGNMHGDTYQQSLYYKDVVFVAMNALRVDGDELETLVASELWPFPTYTDLLFNF